MSTRHLQYICATLNVGAQFIDEQFHCTPANIQRQYRIDPAPVLALDDQWQFAPDDEYDCLGTPPATSPHVHVVNGDNGNGKFYFLLRKE